MSSRLRRSLLPPRETEPSAFTPILETLLARTPGAVGAVLVDADGEAVDYHLQVAGADAYDLRVCAAHWRIVLDDVARSRSVGSPRALVVRGTRRSFSAHALTEGYALVLVLGRRAAFSVSTRAVAVCERALATEAGWRQRPLSRVTYEVDVTCDERNRPRHIRAPGVDTYVDVIGRVHNLGERERAFRVRAVGLELELTLICEHPATAQATWYAEEDIPQRPST